MLVQTRFPLCGCGMAGLLQNQLCEMNGELRKNSGIVYTDQWYFLTYFTGEFDKFHLQSNLKITWIHSRLTSDTIDLQLKKFWELNFLV